MFLIVVFFAYFAKVLVKLVQVMILIVILVLIPIIKLMQHLNAFVRTHFIQIPLVLVHNVHTLARNVMLMDA